MDHEPWHLLGLYQKVDLTPEWQDYEFFFTASGSDAPDAQARGGARIALSDLPQEGLRVHVAEASLRKAPVVGLPPGQELGKVAWARKRDWTARTEAVRLDILHFLRDTEVAYWKGMCDYLHNELGARMPVTGTSAGCTTPQIAAQTVDFVDSHAYWNHPEWPGRP